MAGIQWRPEVNALTTPQSYWIRFVPRNVVDSDELAARLAKALPNYSEEEFRTFLTVRNEIIRESLLNGEQVTEGNAFSYSVSFTGRLDNPDDPLPDLDECLHVRVRASSRFTESVRKEARTERLPMVRKLPLITGTEAGLLKLRDVLNPEGALEISGRDLDFDRVQGADGMGRCEIQGTRSGRAVQTRLIRVEDSEIILMPEIPAQAQPWNNEYTLSVSARYSEHGTLRTGIYGRMLRSPLLVDGFGEETGILTGRAGSPYVSVTGGTVSESTDLRIQVILNLLEDRLRFNLIDMEEEGEAGPAITVAANGDYILGGFSGSPASDLSIRVNNYAALKDMVRNNYSGRLLDILNIQIEPA